MPKYRVGPLNDRFVINVFDDAGKRIKRYRLRSQSQSAAELEAPGVFAELTKPRGKSVTELWKPISPHMLRHTAAVHMAEGGIPMEEIAQYLGHDDVAVTRRVYARFSPTYLRRAAALLEYDDLSTPQPQNPVKSQMGIDARIPESAAKLLRLMVRLKLKPDEVL